MDYLSLIRSKIVADPKEIETQLAFWHERHMRIVFTNGCFDILHRGHVEYLATAANLGNVLIIGLNSDESVKRLKGPTRPVQDEYSRAEILAALTFVTKVIYFGEDTPYNLIKAIKPSILVKGGDYKIEDIVGYDIVTQNGGEVVTIDFVDGYSTTNILNKANS